MTQSHVLTINEFCSSFRISRTHFYNLVKQGYGPKIIKLGRRSLISYSDAKEWCEKISEVDSGKGKAP